MLTMDALDSLAQVATDHLFGFDPNGFLTPQLYRQAPACLDDLSLVQVAAEDPTNMFNVDLNEQTVPGS